MSDENAAYGNDDVIGARLSEDDKNMLRAWYEHLILLDPRYGDKRVRTIAARAMVDDEFRRRLVGDTGSAVDTRSLSSRTGSTSGSSPTPAGR